MDNSNIFADTNFDSDDDLNSDLDLEIDIDQDKSSENFFIDDYNQSDNNNLALSQQEMQSSQILATNQAEEAQFSSDLITAQNESLNNYFKDMSYIQPNLASRYKKFDHDLTYIFKMLPLTFFMDYNDKKIYEYSQKIIAPKSLLLNISEYEDLSFPIYVKINDSEKILGIIDYVEFLDHIYVPNKIFYDINLEENEEQIITIIKKQPPKATSLKIKPLSEEFYDVDDIKTYLEVWLKKMFLTLSSKEIITLPYLDKSISLYIENCEPATTVSIYEIEEIEIDLLPMDEYKNKKVQKVKDIEDKNKSDLENIKSNTENKGYFNKNGNLSLNFNSYRNNINNNDNDNSSNVNASDINSTKSTKSTNSNDFVPFSGKGNKLGSN